MTTWAIVATSFLSGVVFAVTLFAVMLYYTSKHD